MAVEARKDAAPQDGRFDAAGFRRALGSFATGVTIITTRGDDGTPLGLTANSFNSVSLNPPLVLWSLASSSRNLEAFRKAEHWAVHVLGTHQEALSGRFARAGEDKFAGIAVDEGVGGIPLLHDCTARFQCRTAFQYEGGDHVIFVGEVLQFDWTETAPLVFHGGRYAHATRRDPLHVSPRSAEIAGSFSEDFLGYLLGRAHFRFYARIRPLLVEEQLSDAQFFLLSALTLRRRVSDLSLGQGLAGVLDESSHDALEALIARRFVRSTSGGDPSQAAYELTEAGAACAVRVIGAAKAIESEVLEKFGAADTPALKLLLNRLLMVIDPDAAALWGEREGGSGKPPC